MIMIVQTEQLQTFKVDPQILVEYETVPNDSFVDRKFQPQRDQAIIFHPGDFISLDHLGGKLDKKRRVEVYGSFDLFNFLFHREDLCMHI